jgi:hypothetical protein
MRDGPRGHRSLCVSQPQQRRGHLPEDHAAYRLHKGYNGNQHAPIQFSSVVTGDGRLMHDAGTPVGSENDLETAGDRITCDEDFRPVNVLYHLSREHFHRRSYGCNPSLIQQDQSVAILGSKVEVVEYGNNRHAGLTIQVPYQVEDGQLMPDVEVTCWFIQQE